MNTWELCPKCKGNKKHFVTPITEQDCNICNGAGIISSLTGLPPKRDYSTPLLNTPYIPTPPDKILDYPFVRWEITCDTCNGLKQITGVKEDGLTFGYLCPNCK